MRLVSLTVFSFFAWMSGACFIDKNYAMSVFFAALWTVVLLAVLLIEGKQINDR